MKAGPTMTGLTTTGLTNCPTAGDPAATNTQTEPSVFSLSDPNVDPNPDPNPDPNADSWRIEVAARLERYRTRRKPRTPHYPSLLLPFDAPQSWSRPAPPLEATPVADTSPPATQNLAFQINEEPAVAGATDFAQSRPASPRFQEQAPEPSAKVIEFPRSAAIPTFRSSELADPIFDRPRIVEAPEILPPPPALGGMLMEPAPQAPADRRTTAELSVASASIGRRALAALVDAGVLAVALAAFNAIFLRLNPTLNPLPALLPAPLPMFAAALGLIAVLLWAAYEFFFVVYTGSTPGLRAARLRLAAFDGSPLNPRRRRWRVLASFLSAFSAGLGYLWCILDEDGLCWHDRITRSCVRSTERSL